MSGICDAVKLTSGFVSHCRVTGTQRHHRPSRTPVWRHRREGCPRPPTRSRCGRAPHTPSSLQNWARRSGATESRDQQLNHMIQALWLVTIFWPTLCLCWSYAGKTSLLCLWSSILNQRNFRLAMDWKLATGLVELVTSGTWESVVLSSSRKTLMSTETGWENCMSIFCIFQVQILIGLWFAWIVFCGKIKTHQAEFYHPSFIFPRKKRNECNLFNRLVHIRPSFVIWV